MSEIYKEMRYIDGLHLTEFQGSDPMTVPVATLKVMLERLFSRMPPATSFQEGFKDYDLCVIVRAVPKEMSE